MDQQERRRNILIISGIVLIVLATVAAIYFAFFYSETDNETGESPTFGEESGDRAGTDVEREDDRNNQTGVFAPEARLRLLSEEPIAGATTTIINGAEETEVARFLERETGHVFEINLTSLEQERISNTTIPRVHEAVWLSEGSNVILRYLDDDNQTIKTYAAELVEKEDELREGETPFDLQGRFLRDNITHLVPSPEGSEVFWLTNTLRESTGVISNPDGSNIRTVFSSPFTEWLPQWYTQDTINITTKASGYASGYTYNMPIATGELNRVTGGIAGLTTLTSPNGDYALYSQSNDNGIEMYALNTETGESNRLFISTLPEKCAWVDNATAFCGVPARIPEGTLPDVWYQGRVLFTDSIYRIDAASGSAQQIYSPEEIDGEIVDVYKPFTSESGDYFIFNNKQDMSLWAFTINVNDNPFGDSTIPTDVGI